MLRVLCCRVKGFLRPVWGLGVCCGVEGGHEVRSGSPDEGLGGVEHASHQPPDTPRFSMSQNSRTVSGELFHFTRVLSAAWNKPNYPSVNVPKERPPTSSTPDPIVKIDVGSLIQSTSSTREPQVQLYPYRP